MRKKTGDEIHDLLDHIDQMKSSLELFLNSKNKIYSNIILERMSSILLIDKTKKELLDRIKGLLFGSEENEVEIFETMSQWASDERKKIECAVHAYSADPHDEHKKFLYPAIFFFLGKLFTKKTHDGHILELHAKDNLEHLKFLNKKTYLRTKDCICIHKNGGHDFTKPTKTTYIHLYSIYDRLMHIKYDFKGRKEHEMIDQIKEEIVQMKKNDSSLIEPLDNIKHKLKQPHKNIDYLLEIVKEMAEEHNISVNPIDDYFNTYL